MIYGRVYDELRRLAHVVRGQAANQTLDTTALVHEAYLHLVPSKALSWQDRTHFFRVAARAMRQVLAEAARRRLTEKRGGGVTAKIPFEEQAHGLSIPLADLVMLDEALSRLEALSRRQAQVVECRFFAGLSVEETAEALGIGSATVKRDWRSAKAFLTHALS